MMKMKKLFAILLALSLLLGLYACGEKADPVAEAIAAADALAEAGEYEAAIQAYQSIYSYAEIAYKIQEAQYQLERQREAEAQASLGFLYGTWYDLNSDYRITFKPAENLGNADYDHWVNSAVITYDSDYGEQNIETQYEKKDGEVYIFYFGGQPVQITQEDGVTHLHVEEYNSYNKTSTYYDFISEADYDQYGPETVTVTTENWQDYFEIVTDEYWIRNDFGDFSDVRLQTILCIKEEYADRVNWERSSVNFGYSYTAKIRFCSVDFDNQTLSMGGVRFIAAQYDETFALPDYVGENDLDNAVYLMYSGYYNENDKMMDVMENYEVTRVEGTLTIRRN